jgi:3-isopropylmalate/(R)-2-methylmalate dehydratase small subunit
MLKPTYKGKAWKFGDNVSTDSIAPGRLLHLRSNPPEFAKHVFEDVRPEFAKNVQTDDFIIAGNNFGCGSSREIAPLILKLSGVGAIMAKSIGRIFYRNAINNGMLLIQCDTDTIDEGDKLLIDVANREITKEGDPDFRIHFQLGEIEKKILEEDGLLGYIDKHGSLDQL